MLGNGSASASGASDATLVLHAGYTGLARSGPWKSGAYTRIVENVVRRLREAGRRVRVEPFVEVGNRSFDICNGFTLVYRGRRMAYLHQENDRFPHSWHRNLETFDVILSPSPHMTRVLVESGCRVDVVEMPLSGLDPAVFNTDVVPQDDLFPGRFKFLMVGATQPRKNTAALIRVFRECFRDRNDVILVLKSGGYGEDETHRALIGEARNIELITDELTDPEMAALYRSVAIEGAYVHPHRAECVGMPVLEALASGCRAAVTDWGGPHFLPDSATMLTRLPFDLAPSTFMNQPGSSLYEADERPLWAWPSDRALADWMLRIAGTPAIPAESERFATEISARYSYQTLVGRLHGWLSTV